MGELAITSKEIVSMKRTTRTLIVLLVPFSLRFSLVSVALADQPPGQNGYEGQPGNQGETE